jgi:trimethylamine--corrinoid protein Co-methyltransferase
MHGLRFPDLSLDRLLFATQRGVPIVIAPVEMAGATNPIDLFGTLVMPVANNLAGLVIGQLNRPGAPMIMGGVGAAMEPVLKHRHKNPGPNREQ